MPAAVAEQRRTIDQQRFEAYEQWKRQQEHDPRFASVRMLRDDIDHFGTVRPETWERFDIEEWTYGAEILDTPHSHIDRFGFDGQDVIVKESDGVHPRLTLREVYENGLARSLEDAAADPRLEFQVQRDELFMEFYEQIERMLNGELACDTIHMVSACPLPGELSQDEAEGEKVMRAKYYDPDRRKSFDYTARRLPDGRLELSATTLDSSNLEAHAKVLQAYGHSNVSFAIQKSHDFGRYLSYDNTTGMPIEIVIAARVSVYDEEMERQKGTRHRYGREDDSIDAHEFFREHCADYWAGYKAYSELLARHLAGRELAEPLRTYLLRCLDAQQLAGASVLDDPTLARLRQQLWHGAITPELGMGCRELLVYDHHATLRRLLEEFKETGSVTGLQYGSGAGLLDAYADTASANGGAAAANGETFAGCETATSVTSLATAAQVAREQGLTLEQSLRKIDEEAEHCLRIQLYGFTIRRGVICPFCTKKVDARDTAASIECLDDECRTIYFKATGKTTSRRVDKADEPEPEPTPPAKPRAGHVYEVDGTAYRRQLRAVVGGARVAYADNTGVQHIGVAAEYLEARIIAQLSAEPEVVTQAA